MPKIPQITPSISTGVPGADVDTSYIMAGAQAMAQGARQEGAGLEMLGQGISKAGEIATNVGLKLFEQAKIEEAKAAVDLAETEDRLEAENELRRLRAESPDGYIYETRADGVKYQVGSLTEVFQKTVDRTFQARQKSMPSKLAQNMYVDTMSRNYREYTSSATNHENEIRIKAVADKHLVSFSTELDRLVTQPTEASAYGIHDRNLTRVLESTPTIYAASEFEARAMKSGQVTAETLIDGAIVSAQQAALTQGPQRSLVMAVRRQELEKVLQMIDGVSPESKKRISEGKKPFSDMFEPQKKAELRAKVIAGLKYMRDLSHSDLVARTNLYNSGAGFGKASPVEASGLQSEWLDVALNGEESHSVAASKIRDIELNRRFAKYAKDVNFQFLSEDKQKAVVEGEIKNSSVSIKKYISGLTLPEGTAGYTEEAQLRSLYEQKIKISAMQAKDDFPQFAQNDPEIAKLVIGMNFAAPGTISQKQWASYFQQIDTRHKQKYGTTAPQYLSREQVAQMKSFLENPSTTPQLVSSNLNSLFLSTGEKYSQLAAQLPQEYRSLLAGAGNSFVVEERFMAFRKMQGAEVEPEKMKDLKDRIDRKLEQSGVYKAERMIPDTNDDAVQANIIGHRSGIIAGALDIKNKNPGMGDSEAIEKAIATHMSVVTVEFPSSGWFGATVGKGSLINIPSYIIGNRDPKIVKTGLPSALNKYKTADFFRSQGVLIPKDKRGQPILEGQPGEDIYYNWLEKHSQLVPMAMAKGLHIGFIGKDGHWYQLYDKNEKQLIISFDQAMKDFDEYMTRPKVDIQDFRGIPGGRNPAGVKDAERFNWEGAQIEAVD